MEKPVEPSDMPPLTELEHAELRAMERELRNCLSSCALDYKVKDPDAAFEYLRTYAVKFFDFYYNYYDTVANETYRPHLRSASEKFAYRRVLICMENSRAFDNFLMSSSRATRLKTTISENADLYEPLPKPNLAPTIPDRYAAAGVDVASGSPLLKAAVDAFAGRPTTPLPPEVVAQMEAGKAAGIRTASPLSFPAELRRLLEEAQWTPEEVAEETNINWRTVYRHLGGEVRPNPKTRWAYERAFTERLGKQTKLPK